MKTGILLPRSTTHPLIAYNFMDGIHAFLKNQGLDTKITCTTAYIGFGTDPEIVQQEAERLIMEQQVDMLIIFADFPVVECLFPIVKALNKLLLVVNHGAKYPDSWTAQPNVIHHNLNNAVNCWLTGKKAANLHPAAAVVSSYYDGGYSISHSLATSFLNESGNIVFNFVGHQYKTEFNTQPLVSFLKTEPEVEALLAILSGELVPEFYNQLKAEIADRKLNLYGSPVLLEESVLPDHLHSALSLSGYTSWFSAAIHAENQTYCNTFKKNTTREPDSFGVLGWDTAAILKAIFEAKGEDPIDAVNISRHPALQNVSGAKGAMKLHIQTQQYIAPLHYISSKNGTMESLHVVTVEEVEKSFNELIGQELTGISSGWLNTYLCS